MSNAQPSIYETAILAEISEVAYTPVTAAVLAKAMQVSKQSLREFRLKSGGHILGLHSPQSGADDLSTI